MLTIDPISAKTLPHLDGLYRYGSVDELTDTILDTPREALLRLTKSAIARIKVPARGTVPETDNAAKLLEQLIALNLQGDDAPIPQILENCGEGLVLVLTRAIVRYNILEPGN